MVNFSLFVFGTGFLRFDLQKAFGTNRGLTTFGNIDFRVIEKANGAFVITGTSSILFAFETCGQFAVPNQSTDCFVVPLTRSVKAVVPYVAR